MPARLTAVPDVAPRAVAYVRVSKERDDMISPELQRTAIDDHCARAGYTLVETLTDLDLTGRFWKRRQVEQAIAMIEAGRADVLVVWKWSRVARNRKDWAVAVDRIETAGGRLESATEPVDTATSTGRLARGMLAEFAAFESERIGDTWKETHARRVSRGLPANGKPRWGYSYSDGMHHPDEITGPVLAECYRRYTSGESVYSLVLWLNNEGHRTLDGYSVAGPGPWSDTSLRRVLDSGFAAGFITVRGEHRQGAHESLISAEQWQAYQVARASRRVRRSSERSQYVLSGMMRCACGSTMQGGQFGEARQPKFRCHAAHSQRRHPGGYVTMALVEQEVLRWLTELGNEVEQVAQAQLVERARIARRRRDAESLRAEAAKMDEQIARLTRQLAADVVTEAAYRVAVREIEADRDRLLHQAIEADVDSRRGEPAKIAHALVANWDTISVAVRRETLRSLIKAVHVTPGRPRATIRIEPVFAG
jgi:site-specific DNA recombinase